MAAKKKKKSKIRVSVRDTAAAAVEAHRSRVSQLKQDIKAAKKELREVRRELKAAKKAAKKRLKAARAEAKKRLARIAAAARRKRAALAKAIAPKPVVRKAPVTAAPKPVLTSVERLDVIRGVRVKRPEETVGAPSVTTTVAATPAEKSTPVPTNRPN